MLRFGIAGFGLHAVKRLMPGFARATKCRVTALSRRDPEHAQQSAAQYGIPYAHSSVEALAQCPEVDAVFVASPDVCHREHTLISLRHGKHVLCEKPMAMSAAEARQMIDAAKHAGLLLGVAHVFRFEKTVKRVRELISSRELGEIRNLELDFFYPGQDHARRWIANSKIAAGGPMADVGIHCIDALRYMLGDEVVRVQARAERDEGSGELECRGEIELEFSPGSRGRIQVSARDPYRTPLSITGSKGEIVAKDFLTVERAVTLRVQSPSGNREEQYSNDDAYSQQVDAFADWVAGGSPFAAPGEEGWRNHVVLDAAYQSARSGHPVALAIR